MFQLAKRVTYTALLACAVIAAAGSTGTASAASQATVATQQAQACGGRAIADRRLLKVTAINGTTITATNFNGTPITIVTSTTTAYAMSNLKATAANVQVGSQIMVHGLYNRATNTIKATRIDVVLSALSGTITAVNGAALAITSTQGISYTVVTSAQTAFVTPRTANSTNAATLLTKGQRITAEGTLAADGKTFVAVRILIGVGPRRADVCTFGRGA